jgi:tetratricopeptide (TPR) repeat protein
LPLALRMAGARLRHRPGWSVAVLAERMRDSAGRFDAVFGMSLQQLDDEQQRMFRLLGVLPGADFDDGVAAALIDAQPGEMLEELVDAHLVQEIAPGRYRMHDLIRRYAADLAAEDPSAEDALRRVLDHCLAQAVAHDRVLPSPQRPEPAPGDPAKAMAWFDLEYVNLVACFDAAVRLGADEFVAELPSAMRVWFFRHRGTDDQTRMLAAAADAAGRLGRDPAPLLLDLGFALAAAGRLDEALAAYSAAESALATTGSGPAAASDSAAALNSAAAPGSAAAPSSAASPDSAAAPGSAAAPAGDLAAALALRIGFVRRDLGDFAAAQESFRRARELFARNEQRGGESQALAFDGWVTLRLGEPGEAAELARASIALAEGPARITGLVTLGVALAATDSEESLRSLHDALRLAEQHHLRHNEAWCHNGLGLALRATGDFEQALAHHRRALEILEPLAEAQLEADCRRAYEETRRAAGLAS